MKLLATRGFSKPTQYTICGLTVGAVAMVCYFSLHFIGGYKVAALLLLMAVSVLAMLFDILPVLMAALLSALIWNFFFIPPTLTFHINNGEDILMFLLYFVVACVNAVLSFQLRKLEAKAKEKEEKEKTIVLYNTLLNSLSHELKTPIATIISAVDTLQENNTAISTNNRTELLGQIEQAGLRLNRQVENLLNMSRLETGMLQIKTDWCDVNELVNDVINKLDADSERIEFIPDETLPLVKLDRGLMAQVLENLLYNAIQYTPKDSIIIVGAICEAEVCIITVSDSGYGIPEKVLPFVFDKFYRVPDTSTGGSGLGLSIVKGFVEAHHGTVSVHNNKKGGATFTIKVPAETNYMNRLKHE